MHPPGARSKIRGHGYDDGVGFRRNLYSLLDDNQALFDCTPIFSRPWGSSARSDRDRDPALFEWPQRGSLSPNTGDSRKSADRDRAGVDLGVTAYGTQYLDRGLQPQGTRYALGNAITCRARLCAAHRLSLKVHHPNRAPLTANTWPEYFADPCRVIGSDDRELRARWFMVFIAGRHRASGRTFRMPHRSRRII